MSQALPKELITFLNLSRLIIADSELYISGDAILATAWRKNILLDDLKLMREEIENFTHLVINKQ
jgi:hypothetical protein